MRRSLLPFRCEPVLPAGGQVSIWKSITLGTHQSVAALRRALKEARCSIGNLADEALRHPAFTVGKTRVAVDLAAVSVAELGFATAGAPIRDIYRRASQLGLELCRAEAAPQLRLQYSDQRVGEILHIAMTPIATPRAKIALAVGNGGAGLFIIGRHLRPRFVMPPTVRLVFAHPAMGLDRSAQSES